MAIAQHLDFNMARIGDVTLHVKRAIAKRCARFGRSTFKRRVYRRRICCDEYTAPSSARRPHQPLAEVGEPARDLERSLVHLADADLIDWIDAT